MPSCMYCQEYINTQINGYYYTNIRLGTVGTPIRLYYHGQCEQEFENNQRNAVYESPSNNREAVDRANRIHRNPARQFTESGRLVEVRPREEREQDGVRGDEIADSDGNIVSTPASTNSMFYDLYNSGDTVATPRTNRRVHHEIPEDTWGRKTY